MVGAISTRLLGSVRTPVVWPSFSIRNGRVSSGPQPPCWPLPTGTRLAGVAHPPARGGTSESVGGGAARQVAGRTAPALGREPALGERLARQHTIGPGLPSHLVQHPEQPEAAALGGVEQRRRPLSRHRD